MHVEHEEKKLFGHFWDDGEIDHFVGGTDGASVGILFGLFWREVVVYFGEVGEGGEEEFVVYLLGLLGEIDDFFIDFFQVVLEDGVVLGDVNVVEVFEERFHVVLGELSGGGDKPVAEHG